MKKRKMLVVGSLVAAVVIIAITYSLTYSYLIDYEAQENVLTIGKVDLEIDESGYKDSENVVAQSDVIKAPKIHNKGNKSEYVFISVQVPKRSVTLLYEDSDTDSEGKIKYAKDTETDSEGVKVTVANYYEIFKMLTDTTTDVGKVEVKGNNNIDFSYHQGADPSAYKEGWVLIESDLTHEKYDEFIFGYNKILVPKETTSKPIFDKVRLKSFIDQEVTGNDTKTEVEIKAYGIQTRNLGIDGLDDDKGELSEEQLEKIYYIVKNKNEQTDN